MAFAISEVEVLDEGQADRYQLLAQRSIAPRGGHCVVRGEWTVTAQAEPVGPGQIRTSLVSMPRRGITRFVVLSLG